MNTIQYVVEYEYAAVALLLVLIALFAVRDKFHTAANSIFAVIIGTTLVSALLHIFTVDMITHPRDFPLWVNYGMHTAYLLVYQSLAPLSLLYISEITRQGKQSRTDRIIALTVFITDAVLLLTTSFTKLIIYFDKDMNYCHGPFFGMLSSAAILILAYELCLFVRFRKKLKPVQNISMMVFMVFTVAAAIIQLVRPEQILSNYMIALSLVMYYVSLENPAEYVDSITCCSNAEAFSITVDSLIAGDKDFSVVAFYPHGFNYYAELLGLRESGRVCAVIADKLERRVGKGNIYYLGNWHFVILSQKLSTAELTEILQEFFSKPVNFNGIEASVTPYICTMTCPCFATSAKDIRDAINYTLKSMKGEKETVSEITPKAIEARQRELKILAAIRRAIKDNSFRMYYQPLYNTVTGTFSSAEALIRLIDDDLGFISPDEFIPLAETNGLITEIGELSFRTVCEFMKSGKAQELGVRYVEVNLSVLQCSQDKLSAQLLSIMDEYGIPPEQINFEITETAGLANYDTLIRNMNNLISRGVTFAMDDYGTGFSTANYLISLPAEIVKIDKSILWPAMENEEAFIILRHTIEMLRSLNKKIVVEGVETEEMVTLLTEIGCDFLQGYYYSKPVPPEAFITFLTERAAVKCG